MKHLRCPVLSSFQAAGTSGGDDEGDTSLLGQYKQYAKSAILNVINCYGAYRLQESDLVEL